ncbi:MAG: redoxin domain-containing protein [Microcoleus sp. PH2017_10_PVI_O_A]|uniref:peroxiredoxin family protein n=1 Tax=unclassified Microcoleus TaxID=2642155 RepID=UPI001DC7EAA5|nr:MULTISPECIES: redoxin domain-containing protein [unclassified Microcoleus]MCC3409899.1 redoxin domain-containing protein [Microcoleus sp. PH2017_10_PVI_O_A]MCC3464073.1 redoxin domain-containing protein [Microcoleus sp. PH2017_11_PCY_U_A]MCC3482426.1 redoxin domain-containing protein [Microcoleus sp. PH2017_12_PCY_D_A]MCC3531014.1 redoxin domain-containing protein [Microcoleus sp. PH2017_21_RUC_O_A]MCC3539742.1 redoxin domain-containing protein [Microcoleus sp. PH2017_22_RUC_O_B]
MPVPLEIGAVAPEFLTCEGNWNTPVPARDQNGNEISIKDFDGKCLVLIFLTEAREEIHRQPTMKLLEMMKGFATKYKNANVSLVAAGADERGMMLELVKEAELNFPYIPLLDASPMGHEYNAYFGVTSAITYAICDGKIHQSWDNNYPKDYDASHFEEVLSYIAANNLA